eukprot:NODE_634_length_2233_cov_61.422275_g604_i0.p1 GENE.NODE_634_length_2233_cov_61.422275_g604_i0~~NODE_634_length_2233_cov_61.422275_g604_i0.p1  ORF type:complete len:657 (+),score=35.97 NODE_634_length_2233_cov_61.422275_g604_i0:73-2043(+)
MRSLHAVVLFLAAWPASNYARIALRLEAAPDTLVAPLLLYNRVSAGQNATSKKRILHNTSTFSGIQALAALWGPSFAPEAGCTTVYSCTLTESHEPSVHSIVARGNGLNGTLPGVLFTHFRDVTMLDLSLNNFTGTLPSKITHSNLRTFLCGGCNFTGSLPELYMPSLERLTLHGMFTGGLPEQWGQLSSLVTLELSFLHSTALANATDHAEGYIPSSWCNLTRLRTLSLWTMQSAVLPDCWNSSSMPTLQLRTSTAAPTRLTATTASISQVDTRAVAHAQLRTSSQPPGLQYHYSQDRIQEQRGEIIRPTAPWYFNPLFCNGPVELPVPLCHVGTVVLLLVLIYTTLSLAAQWWHNGLVRVTVDNPKHVTLIVAFFCGIASETASLSTTVKCNATVLTCGLFLRIYRELGPLSARVLPAVSRLLFATIFFCAAWDISAHIKRTDRYERRLVFLTTSAIISIHATRVKLSSVANYCFALLKAASLPVMMLATFDGVVGAAITIYFNCESTSCSILKSFFAMITFGFFSAYLHPTLCLLAVLTRNVRFLDLVLEYSVLTAGSIILSESMESQSTSLYMLCRVFPASVCCVRADPSHRATFTITATCIFVINSLRHNHNFYDAPIGITASMMMAQAFVRMTTRDHLNNHAHIASPSTP